MKKSIAVLLSIMVLFSCMHMVTFAATDDSQVEVSDILDSTLTVNLPDSITASSHGETTFDLALSGNPGFAVAIFDFDFGSEAITVKELNNVPNGVTAKFSNNAGKSTLAFYSLGADYSDIGTLATVTLSIGAFSGEKEVVVTVEEGNICNNNAEAIEYSVTNTVLTVNCSHTYVYEGRTEPSCSKEGEIRYICTICDYIKITLIDKTPHSFSSEKHVVSEPDCDDEGIIAPICEYCFAIDEANKETVAPIGHKYYGDPIVTKNPTCTEDGSQYQICYVCNHKNVTAIPKLGHDGGTWRTTLPSDCTQVGVASRYCNRCDEVLETMEKELGEHFYAWAVVKAPTCTEEGLEEYLCVVCGEQKIDERVIPVTDHVPDEEVVVKEPTCSEKGVAETHCKDCDHLISSREIDTVDHVKNSLTVVTAPTAEQEGAGEYRCKECDAVIESVVIPVTYGEFYIETVPTIVGRNSLVKVFIKNNPGFSVGIVRIKYDVESLIYNNLIAGDITEDITVGVPASGEIAVLISLEDAQYTENGLAFTVDFTLTQDAQNGAIELYYRPQDDFAAQNGDRVFFNMKSGEIEIVDFIRGDVNGDGKVDTSDLAALKLYLAGAEETTNEGADIDQNGKIDTGDLAGLKLHLAGVP